VFVFVTRESPLGNWFEQNVEHFFIVPNLDVTSTPTFIHSFHLDILIDLDGHTEGTGALSVLSQPAPLQINFLGYLSTMASSTVQYMIVDKTFFPLPRNVTMKEKEENDEEDEEEEEKRQKTVNNLTEGHFTEKLIFLPHSLAPTSHSSFYKAAHIAPFPSRESLDLPKHITTDMFFTQLCPNQEGKKRNRNCLLSL
jgi:predicted O-linked N-acetylglucosamine transferase (SPINDLY family)